MQNSVFADRRIAYIFIHQFAKKVRSLSDSRGAKGSLQSPIPLRRVIGAGRMGSFSAVFHVSVEALPCVLRLFANEPGRKEQL